MTPLFGLVSQFEQGKSKIALQLHLIRNYDQPDFKNKDKVQSHECIFQDNTENRIHATIKSNTLTDFTSILEVGKVYVVMNFIVVLNIMKIKPTSCKYKPLIFKETRMNRLFGRNFPIMFQFNNFDDISSMENIQDKTFVWGRTISVTLWENYVDESTNKVNNCEKGPVPIILAFCRPTTYRGEIKLTNVCHTTNIIVDETIVEIKNFKEEYFSSNKVGSSSISTLTTSAHTFNLKFPLSSFFISLFVVPSNHTGIVAAAARRPAHRHRE
ncbi:hypothetical protein C2S51_009655 [Perilla frutescens var. frutescens]|nr:hypothetical protein C2S51_009655 [Perilla frutescens var. frutescens]